MTSLSLNSSFKIIKKNSKTQSSQTCRQLSKTDNIIIYNLIFYNFDFMFTKIGLASAFGSIGAYFYYSYVENIKSTKKEILERIKFD
jgi:hypothetical protein